MALFDDYASLRIADEILWRRLAPSADRSNHCADGTCVVRPTPNGLAASHLNNNCARRKEGTMPRFCVETKDDHYEASWDEIPTVEGIGPSPQKAIASLKEGLRKALSDDAALREIGRLAVESCLDEMDGWEGERLFP